MSIEEVRGGVHKAVHALPFATLDTAHTLLSNSLTALDEAACSTHDSDLKKSAVQHDRCRSEIARVFDVCSRVQTLCSDYLVSIGAEALAGAPQLAPLSPTNGELSAEPLHSHLEDHVFQGHVRYKQFTGYHSRPTGADTGPITIGTPGATDAAGCYWAPATATTRSGRERTVPKTFFPDHWSAGEVRQAIRIAFDRRTRTYKDNGEAHPTRWQATYRGTTIEGKIFHGTDFDTAALNDVGTAYPVHADHPKRPDYDR